MKYREFIQDNFLIDHPETGEMVPFVFRSVQNKYYDMLCDDYGEKQNFVGAREYILKSRKMGFTSPILAIFCVDLILSKHPRRALEISYKDDATKQHFRRAKGYVMSYFAKRTGIVDEKRLEKIVFLSINEGQEFVLRHNKASMYFGTARTATGERGGTVQDILFTEFAHYPDTGKLNVAEMIEGTSSMVAVGTGRIFRETTANGVNHAKKTWDQAKRGEIDLMPRFFSWREFYTPAEFELIKAGFADKSLVPQEYPDNDDEAFLASGKKFFDIVAMQYYKQNERKPIIKNLIYV